MEEELTSGVIIWIQDPCTAVVVPIDELEPMRRDKLVHLLVIIRRGGGNGRAGLVC